MAKLKIRNKIIIFFAIIYTIYLSIISVYTYVNNKSILESALKDRITQTPMSFKDHGVDYDKFKDALKTLSLDAYEDQCTPANPRLALLKDLEGIMEAAWHGFDKKKYEENK